jgi:thymidylate synthase (FAD)
MQIIERAGRTAYKSEDKITSTSAVKFVRMVLSRGHESVIEHASASIRFVCDRGISHEIVRHRLFSFTQESTRYCNYGNERNGGQITVLEPPNLSSNARSYWVESMMVAEANYLRLLGVGIPPQIARSVLPNSLKTEIVVTGNFRQWRHFFNLRTAKTAHPQMQETALMALAILECQYPDIFEDCQP